MTHHTNAHQVLTSFDNFGITLAGVVAQAHADRTGERQDRETLALARAIVARRRAVAAKIAEIARAETAFAHGQRVLALRAAAARARKA